jgi:prevent-host-death family protein
MIMYKGGSEMPQIRPIRDLRNTSEISEACHSRREPIFITKNGYGDLVIMSIETYEGMLETAKLDTAILEAEAEYDTDGQLHDARPALASLRRKHFG